jgi:cell pole-organizing protein PopZ
MAKVSTAQEPSMEEILASIRRIISEDEHGLGAPKAASEFKAPEFKPSELPALTPKLPSVPVSAADIDALFSARVAEFAGPLSPSHSRTEAAPSPMVEPRMLRPAPPVPEPVRAAEPVRVAEPARAPAPVHADKPAPAPVRPVLPVVNDVPASEPLLSPISDAIIHSAFGNLAGAVSAAHSQTLDDLVKDMLRPMLKTWLDTNLPPLVERLVRDEIERLSRGR